MNSTPGSRPKVVLYTRAGCHLCDSAKALLLRHELSPREVDIDGDPQLTKRFGEWVPVVEIGGKIRFRGQLNEKLLKRLLNGLDP